MNNDTAIANKSQDIDNVINIKINENKVQEYAAKEAAKQLNKAHKAQKRASSGQSPTMTFVKEAFNYYGYTIKGDGCVYKNDGTLIEHPEHYVTIYYDIKGEKENINPKHFTAAISVLCEETKRIERDKIIETLGQYKFDPNINIIRAAKIMLDGVDFNSKEGKERLQVFTWAIESTILQIKRKMNRLPVFDHKVVVLVGAYSQGDQKTEFVKNLFGPLKELQARVSLSDLCDTSRNYKKFYDNYALCCDEMKGVTQGMYAEIKESITTDVINARVLGTQRQIKVPNNATIMATSNYETYTVIQDTTGSRRFLDIKVTQDIKRDRFVRLKTEIDWVALWQGVKFDYTQEEIDKYLAIRDEVIAPMQKINTFKDIVDEFVDENCLEKGNDFVSSNWIHQELVIYAEYKRFKGKIPTIQVFGSQISDKYGISPERHKQKRGYFINLSQFNANRKSENTQSDITK